MAIPVPPSPFEMIRWSVRTAGTVAAVPGRLAGLLRAAESVVARAEDLVNRTERVVADAEGTVVQVRRVTSDAAGQVAATRPVLEFVREFSVHEVRAAIALVDELPRLAAHLDADVLPLLGTLERVGPDLHELLDVVKDVRQAILGIPGFEYLRRRGEDKDE